MAILERRVFVDLAGVRRSVGISRAALASAAAVSHGTIANAERGRPLYPDTARAIVAAIESLVPPSRAVRIDLRWVRYDGDRGRYAYGEVRADLAPRRDRADVSVKALASAAGVAWSTVRRAERGFPIRPDKAAAIDAALRALELASVTGDCGATGRAGRRRPDR